MEIWILDVTLREDDSRVRKDHVLLFNRTDVTKEPGLLGKKIILLYACSLIDSLLTL